MTLFFETAAQANGLIGSAAIGFLTAFCIQMAFFTGKLRPIWDILALLCSGVALLAFAANQNYESFRGYQLLGWLTGYILYTQGILRLITGVLQLLRRKSVRKQEKEAHMKK